MTTFVFITGGVVSSLGKGVAAASLGAILEALIIIVAVVVGVLALMLPRDQLVKLIIFRDFFDASCRQGKKYSLYKKIAGIE